MADEVLDDACLFIQRVTHPVSILHRGQALDGVP